MNRFLFTQARIKALPTPERGRVDYFDSEMPKLNCRVSSSGSKVYTVLGHVNKKRYRVTLGHSSSIAVATARELCREQLVTFAKGVVPEHQRDNNVSLEGALVDYIKNRHPKNGKQLKPRTIHGYHYCLDTSFADWKLKPVKNITPQMVVQRYKSLTNTGTATANVAMRTLRVALKHAKAVGIVDEVATDVLVTNNAWHNNKRRERVIKLSELAPWYEAVNVLTNERAKVYFLTLIYMGFRSSEALHLKWSDIDLKDKTITARDTKNHSDHTLPIPMQLLPYLKGLKKLTGKTPYLFVSDVTGRPMSLPRKQLDKVIAMTDITFSSHDLRRTFATIAEAVAVPLTTIKHLLNHAQDNDVTGGYIITQEETLREAIDKIGLFIHNKATQKNNVVRLQA